SATTPLEMQLIWLTLLYLGYGAAFSWAYNELAFPETKLKPNTGEVRLDSIDRREFIIRVGAASATLTVVGAGLGAILGESTPEPSRGGTELASTTNMADLPNADASVVPAPGTRPE